MPNHSAAGDVQGTDWQARGLLVAFLMIAAVAITAVSYIDEDAFISFRTVENLINGYGLRWNVDERVQAFTNPLWVLLLIPLRLALGNVVVASYLLSITASTMALAIVAWPLRRAPLLFALALFMPLLLSRAFTDYTNAGFENPMTFLCTALFTVRFMRTDEPIPWRLLTALSALLAVNRLDAVLLTAPAMLWLYVANFREARHRDILVGALPLIGWLLFSVFYYGVPLPNTKYAKLDAGIRALEYYKFGAAYLLDIVRNDAVTFAGLVGGVIVAGIGLIRWLKTREAVWARLGSLALGVIVSSVYIVWIGGDFMAGRHWSSPFFLAVVLIAFAMHERGAVSQAPLLAYVSVMLGLKFAIEPLLMERDTIKLTAGDRQVIMRNRGIHDQRYNCSFYEALLATRGGIDKHPWSQLGLDYKRQAEKMKAVKPEERFVIARGIAGKLPFHAGPDVVVIDVLALSDPLLARLPSVDRELVLIGHLERHVPAGYLEARRTGSLTQMDPALQLYYEKLRYITTGPLFEWERLVTIMRFHLGEYDEHLHAYLAGAYREEVKQAQAQRDREKRDEAISRLFIGDG